MESIRPLGLVAGKGRLPRVVCETAARRGVPVTAVAFDRETAGNLEGLADVKVVGIGQPSKVFKHFNQAGVKKVCLIGKIEKKVVFKNVRLDLRALKAVKNIVSKNDTPILLGIIEEFEKEGFEVVKQTDWLPDLLPKKGILGKKKPSKNISSDFDTGMDICRELARRDIGQTVILKEGAVLAVEALEGTDAAIERGCKLGGKGAVMVKTSRPNQDFRFDIPSIGPDTIKQLAKHKAAGLAVEAHRTVIIDISKVISLCNKAGIVFAAL